MRKFIKICMFFVSFLILVGACDVPTIDISNNFVYAEDGRQYRTVRARHILVNTEDEAWALKSRITEGESFESLATKYSKCPSSEKGGDLGYFNRGQMVPEFENVAFETPIGEVSDPVKTRFGWHLIKVTRKM